MILASACGLVMRSLARTALVHRRRNSLRPGPGHRTKRRPLLATAAGLTAATVGFVWSAPALAEEPTPSDDDTTDSTRVRLPSARTSGDNRGGPPDVGRPAGDDPVVSTTSTVPIPPLTTSPPPPSTSVAGPPVVAGPAPGAMADPVEPEGDSGDTSEDPAGDTTVPPDMTTTPPPPAAQAESDAPGAPSETTATPGSVDAPIGSDRSPVDAAGAEYEVRPGDSLWAIAATRLPEGATDADIDRYWRAIYAANASLIGDNPDLILPGQLLRLPTS